MACLWTLIVGVIFSAATSGYTAPAKVLLLGDEVMLAYQHELTELVGDKAELTFLEMPKSADPDWRSFCNAHVYSRGYNIIHFTYGRELFHSDGRPRTGGGDAWRAYEELIQSLKVSGAFLIGCSTTPIRGKMEGSKPGITWAYNIGFRRQLGPNGIKMHDLWDFTRMRINEMVQDNSHLPTKTGKQLMAEQVANRIFEALDEGQDPDRPRILVVGDSIVGGYFGATRDQFAGKAIVFSGGTTYNDAQPDWKTIVDGYIEKGEEKGWDIIQFNWGLHAMKHVDKNNETVDADTPGARIQFSAKEYIEQLELFVNELHRTGATLVFATTTPIPDGADGSIVHIDQLPYNESAKKLMKDEGILVNDLYGFTRPRLAELQHPNNVHFSAHGSEQLAKQNYEVLAPLLKR